VRPDFPPTLARARCETFWFGMNLTGRLNRGLLLHSSKHAFIPSWLRSCQTRSRMSWSCIRVKALSMPPRKAFLPPLQAMGYPSTFIGQTEEPPFSFPVAPPHPRVQPPPELSFLWWSGEPPGAGMDYFGTDLEAGLHLRQPGGNERQRKSSGGALDDGGGPLGSRRVRQRRSDELLPGVASRGARRATLEIRFK
jgi:hypothetical protein